MSTKHAFARRERRRVRTVTKAKEEVVAGTQPITFGASADGSID
jgi:hypothetical protein